MAQTTQQTTPAPAPALGHARCVEFLVAEIFRVVDSAEELLSRSCAAGSEVHRLTLTAHVLKGTATALAEPTFEAEAAREQSDVLRLISQLARDLLGKATLASSATGGRGSARRRRGARIRKSKATCEEVAPLCESKDPLEIINNLMALLHFY